MQPDFRRVVNVGDLTPVGDRFVDLPAGFDRLDFSGLPQNRLERLLTRPRVSRYRAAVASALAARNGAVISHLPAMSAAVASACKALRREPPHLAFSFNFTKLPTGAKLRYFRSALRSVTEFFVFSDHERELYPDHFRLDPSRFRRLDWTQDAPAVSPDAAPLPAKSYVSAIGGEGRDYATLIAAARLLPYIPFIIVARPHSIPGALPGNVRLLCNIPAPAAWRIGVDSTALVVPLKSRTTRCGHITLVSAQLLGLPVVTTDSDATRDYTGGPGVALCQPGDPAELAALIEERHRNWESHQREAQAEVGASLRRYDRQKWSDAVADFLQRHVDG